MSEKTKIEWCDYSWSPWEGCTKVSPGCANCYAEANNARWRAGTNWGKGRPRRRTMDWDKPRRWNLADLRAPGSPRPRIFPSICDWLDEEVPIEWLEDFLGLIMSTPHLDWLLLTKRPENWRKRLHSVYLNCDPGAPAKEYEKGFDVREMARKWIEEDNAPQNIWIGTSVEDQPRADARIPALLKIPARVRFLSVEPMLEPVDIRFGFDHLLLEVRPTISWVIVGGESGPKARPCNIAWVRDIVRQCAVASVPCFVKQLGSFCIEEQGSQRRRILWDHPKGGDQDEWPEDLRVRQFPESQEGGGK